MKRRRGVLFTALVTLLLMGGAVVDSTSWAASPKDVKKAKK